MDCDLRLQRAQSHCTKIAIFCRNALYPATVPPPTQTLLDLETFQLDMTEESLKKEADFTLKRYFPPSEPDVTKLTGEILRLFALYCTSSLERRAMDIMQALVPRAKDMETFAGFALANFREPLATEMKRLVMDIMREECEEDILRAPSPDLFDSSQQSRANATLTATKFNPLTPKPEPIERKPIILSRNKRSAVEQKPSGLSRSAHASLTKTPVPIKLDDDDEDDDIIQPGLVKSVFKATSSHNSDEETRMSPAKEESDEDVDFVDREENAILGNDADSLMMDMDRSNPMSSSDSRSGEASVASAQTMLFDEESSQTNGSRRSVEPKKIPKKKAAAAPKPAKEDFAMPATPSHNPFRKNDSVPPITRGISTMEELTRARTTKRDVEKPAASFLNEAKKRARKSQDQGGDLEPKKRGRPKGGKAKENTEVIEVETPVVKKSGPVGLARFGFITSKVPLPSEQAQASAPSNGADNFIDDSDDL